MKQKSKMLLLFFFKGSLILFDILSNQKDLSLSKSPVPFAVANGVVKQPHFQEKQVWPTNI